MIYQTLLLNFKLNSALHKTCIRINPIKPKYFYGFSKRFLLKRLPTVWVIACCATVISEVKPDPLDDDTEGFLPS